MRDPILEYLCVVGVDLKVWRQVFEIANKFGDGASFMN
jgi:hypothetical protein